MKRVAKWTARVLTGVVVLALVVSFFWPVYDLDNLVPSPDGTFALVVLRGDAAAFADFSYRAYVFPHSLAPTGTVLHTRIWMTPKWRMHKYLVYSSYNTPEFRWTGSNSLHIEVGDLYPEHIWFDPVKVLGWPNNVVTVSLEIKRNNPSEAPKAGGPNQ